MVMKLTKRWLNLELLRSCKIIRFNSLVFKTVLVPLILVLGMVNNQVYAYGSLNPIANNLLEKSTEKSSANNAVNTDSKPAQSQISATQIRLSKQQVVLGESLTFVMKGRFIGDAISNIDLSAFTHDFVIDDLTQGDGFLRIKLFPISVGEFVIKGQRTANVDIPEFKVKVAKNPDVTIQWQAPNNLVVGQELVSWLAKVEVDNAAFKVRYLVPEYEKNTDLQIDINELSIQQQQSNQQDSNLEITEHNLVAVYEMPSPLKQQALRLHSPVIEVKNTTHKRWKFFDQPLVLNITPLPSFLPLSATVGTVNWQLEDLQSVYETGQLYHWQWQLSAQNVTADYLKGMVYELLRSLQISGVQFLSEEIQTQQGFNEQGLFSEVTVKIPFRIEQSDFVRFPELTLVYFSPQTQLVEQQNWQAQGLLALPTWLVWLGYWLILIMFFAVLFIGLWVIKNLLVIRQFKHRLSKLSRVSATENKLIIGLWQQMQLFYKQHPSWHLNLLGFTSAVSNWKKERTNLSKVFRQNIAVIDDMPTPQTLAQWQAWYANFYVDSPELGRLIAVMNQLSYQEKSIKNSVEENQPGLENKHENFSQNLLQAELQQALQAWRKTL